MSEAEHRALALKWRPARFSDVVGQPHVVQTLTNALVQGRVAQAYLFAGPRGVGKTTCARILARAVTCEKGQGPDPCGECSICREVMSGRSLDVIEIDAASTGKADDIRDLREVVRLAPARARKKVFIIDEVHSMSGQAYNALLKTLEEPPAHVMFIMATTDPHKVPPTIHSRCQRFDFHPLGPVTVSEHLKRIAEAEGIEVEGAALGLIAKMASGAMRDGQMLLEQVAAFCPGKVVLAEVRSFLGLVEREWVERFLTVLRDRDSRAGLNLVDELVEGGRSPEELLEEVQEELRDALMCKLGAEVAPMAENSFLAAPARKDWFGEEELLSLLAHVRRAIEELSSRQISHPRIAAELAVARLMRRERALSWAEVEAQISRLEAGLRGGAGPLPPPGTQSRPAMSPGAPPRPAAPAFAGTPVPEAPPVPAGDSLPLEELAGRWSDLLGRMKTSVPAALAYLKGAKPVGVEGETVILEVVSDFHREGLQGGDIRGLVEEALSALTGRAVKVRAVAPTTSRAAGHSSPATQPGGQPWSTPAPTTSRDAGHSSSTAPRRVASPERAPLPEPPAGENLRNPPDWTDREPMVKAALEIFKARFVGIKGPGQK